MSSPGKITALVSYAVALSGEGQHPERQVCLADALYDVDSIVADPRALPKEAIRALGDQIVSNLERAWEIAGGSDDQLDGMMLQISQAVARELKSRDRCD